MDFFKPFLHVCMPSCQSGVQLFATLWTIAHQAPLPMGFSRQEHWSGLPGPPPGDLSNSGIKPTSLMSLALAVRFFTTNATWEVQAFLNYTQFYVLLKDFQVSMSKTDNSGITKASHSNNPGLSHYSYVYRCFLESPITSCIAPQCYRQSVQVLFLVSLPHGRKTWCVIALANGI